MSAAAGRGRAAVAAAPASIGTAADGVPGESFPSTACAGCLTRAWVLDRLSGHIDTQRGDVMALLELGANELVQAVGGRDVRRITEQLAAFDPADARAAIDGADRVTAVCRCARAYPDRLRELVNAPAVLHLAGRHSLLTELPFDEPVAIVGTRAPTPYGNRMAESLAAGLAAAGVPVISGMALGIDSAAHDGALRRGGTTVAVLPSAVDRPYPASRRQLYARILAGRGAGVSELPMGTRPRRWTYTARNRIIAGLAAATIVVEAGEGSGALLTAQIAGQLGRPVGAVPGRVGTAQAVGTNALLAAGAGIVRGAQDVLDMLFGAGERQAARTHREPLTPELASLHAAIAEGHDTPGALTRVGFTPAAYLAGLAALELGGYIAREPGGRFSVIS